MASENLIDVLAMAGTFARNQGAVPNEVRDLEGALGVRLPGEYSEFLRWAAGGELVAGDQVVELWDPKRVVERNARLAVGDFLPGVVLIGSNEGETALGLDFRSSPAAPVAVPFGDLSPESVRVIGKTLGDAVGAVISGEIDLDEVCYV
jgi:hypothetical protein